MPEFFLAFCSNIKDRSLLSLLVCLLLLVRWLKAKFEVNVDTTDKSTIFFYVLLITLALNFR